jgi:hypothetical protein
MLRSMKVRNRYENNGLKVESNVSLYYRIYGQWSDTDFGVEVVHSYLCVSVVHTFHP